MESPLEKFFVELDKRDPKEAKLLANYYKEKETFIDLSKIKYTRRHENEKGVLLISKDRVTIYHKPTRIFLYLKQVTPLDIESLEYDFLKHGDKLEKIMVDAFYRKIYLDGNIEIGFYYGNI